MDHVLNGFFIPRWRPDIWKTIIAVLGTTIVPYNLFLHAALVKQDLSCLSTSYLKRDTFIAVSFGGIISSSIIIAAAGANINQIGSINDLGDAKINAHLLKYDTAHGPFSKSVVKPNSADGTAFMWESRSPPFLILK